LVKGTVYYLSRNYFIAIIFAGLVFICNEFFNPADQAILEKIVEYKIINF